MCFYIDINVGGVTTRRNGQHAAQTKMLGCGILMGTLSLHNKYCT